MECISNALYRFDRLHQSEVSVDGLSKIENIVGRRYDGLGYWNRLLQTLGSTLRKDCCVRIRQCLECRHIGSLRLMDHMGSILYMRCTYSY